MRIDLPDARATEALGAALARALIARPGALVFLRGDLGAGKTTLARGWLHALGVQGHIRSPSYTLVEPYEAGGRSVLHLDLYRLEDPAELEQLGLFDTPPDRSLWLVEWPERAGGRLPRPDLEVRLAAAGAGRSAELIGAPEILAMLKAGPDFSLRCQSTTLTHVQECLIHNDKT
jgi:tRNA threonylcarbamoyladenosine biosynthesis protein TsaE